MSVEKHAQKPEQNSLKMKQLSVSRLNSGKRREKEADNWLSNTSTYSYVFSPLKNYTTHEWVIKIIC